MQAGRTVPVSPDGERYLAMARGQTMPRPFLFRWLAPVVLGPDPNHRWLPAARISFAALCVLGALYTRSWAALFVPFGLAGLTVQTKAPVLVDLHAMALALGAAVLMGHGWWYLALPVAMLAAATKETSPLFIAAWSWAWLPLFALLVPAARSLTRQGDDVCGGHAHEALVHPFRTSWEVHRRQPFAWWVLPLGALVIGACAPTLQVGVVLALAYGQCVLATDLVRLYTWCWPTLALRTFQVIPSRWWLLAVVAHVASPFRGEGW